MSKIAVVFPGQGSQKVGMGRDFAERRPELLDKYFRPADDILGFGITDLCFNGPDGELVQTQNTQPAIFLVSMAVLDVLRAEGISPEAVAGHSLGEYSALVCAGVLRFEDALRLVRRRGELMAGVNARTPGAMAAIMGLAPELVDAICREAREAGVNEFLAKPLTARGVIERLHQAVENPRPYVRSDDYFGPDRRRRNDANYKGPFRRSTDEKKDVAS